MMCISSPAGRRLAVAKAAHDKAIYAYETDLNNPGKHRALCEASLEKEDAGDAVAEELIAQRFHEMEGD